MSNVPISSLPIALSLSGNESVPVVQAGTTKRTTSYAISAFAGLGTTANNSFLTAAAETGLPSSRRVTGVSPIAITDHGAGSTFAIGITTNATSGYILTSTGATAAPTFQAFPGFNLTQTATGSHSGA